MPPALQTKLAGLPRWAWLAIVAGGLTIGLILRARQSTADEQVDAEEGVDETIQDDTMLDDTGFLGSGDYEFEDDDGRVAYPPANDPNIEINIGGGNGGGPGGKSCKDKKPTDKPPKGYSWTCASGKWVLKPNKRPGSSNGGGGHNNGGGKHNRDKIGDAPDRDRVAVPQLTGGGPPSRRATHRTDDGSRRRRQAQRILVPGAIGTARATGVVPSAAAMVTREPYDPVNTMGRTRIKGS